MFSKYHVFHACIALLCLAVLMTGCGRAREAAETARDAGEAARFARDLQKGEATLKTEDGEAVITLDEEAGITSITATDAEGKETTYTASKTADLSGLGVAIYPGATQEGSHTFSADDSVATSAILSTTDSFDKVAKFYKDKYPGTAATEFSSQDVKTLVLNIEEGDSVKVVSVTQSGSDEKVSISIVTETR